MYAQRHARAILVGLALCAVVSACVAFRLLHRVGDVTTPESGIAAIALDFARTGKLYRPLNLPPYTPVAYGPALYTLLALFVKISGADLTALVLSGRLLSFVCYVLLGFVVYSVARRSGQGRGISIMAALLLWADPSFAGWNATVRPDMPALLLSTLAIAVCMAPGSGARFAAGICAGSAPLLKQTYVAAAFSILLFTLWGSGSAPSRIRRAGLFCLAASLPVVVASTFFALRGDSPLSHAALIANVAVSPSTALGLLKEQWYQPACKLSIFSCAVGLWFALHEPGLGGSRAKLVALYFISTRLFAAAFSVNTGAYTNYYLEPHAAVALALPFAVRNLTRDWTGIPAPLRTLLVAMTAVILVEQAIRWKTAWPDNQDQPTEAAIRDLVTGTRVLSTESYFSATGPRSGVT